MPNPKKITIVGTGPIACTVIGLLVRRNRELQKQIDDLQASIKKGKEEEEEQKELTKQIEALENQKTVISVLGRDKNSRTYKAFQKGFILNFASKFDQDHNTPRITVSSADLGVVTTNSSEIPEKQDYIFVTTKQYSYTTTLFHNLNKLRKDKKVGLFGRLSRKDSGSAEKTKFILAHNGFPCWFGVKKRVKGVEVDSHLNEEIYNLIGKDSVMGCVLDFAVNIKIGDDGIVCDVNTPSDKISMPLASPKLPESGRMAEEDRWIRDAFSEAGVNTSVREHGIYEDVLYKVQLNTVVSALSILSGLSIGEELFNSPIYKEIIKEVSEFSERLYGIKLRDDVALNERLQRSIGHKPSMQVDFEEGSPIELSMCKDVLAIIAMKQDIVLNGTLPMTTFRQVVTALEEVVKMRDQNIEELKKQNKQSGGSSDDVIQKAVNKTDEFRKEKLEEIDAELKKVRPRSVTLTRAGSGSKQSNSSEAEVETATKLKNGVGTEETL